MAIRKVLGARTRGLLGLLLKPFMVYILLANVIGLPLVWVAVERWLDSFAYRIQPGVSVFLIAVCTTFAIGVLSILWRSVTTARVNPAEALAGD